MAPGKNTMEVCLFFIDVREYFKPGVAKKEASPGKENASKGIEIYQSKIWIATLSRLSTNSILDFVHQL
jgi:hypothetical protein